MSAYKHYALVALKAVVSVGLIAYVLSQTDLGDVIRRLTGIRLDWLAAALGVMLLQILIVARRWTIVLTRIHERFPLLPALRMMFIGIFFNQTLPSAIGGDVVRIWATHRSGVPVGAATSSVLLDRLTALGATVVFIGLSLPVALHIVDDPRVHLGLGAAVLLILLGFTLLMTLDAVPGVTQRWRLTRYARALALDARRVFLSPKVCLYTMTLSLIVLIFTGVSVFMLARALGIDVPLLECVVLMPPVILLTMVPISIAGWGIREFGMVTVFSYVQLNPTDALTLSLAFGITQLVVGLPGGLLWLHKPIRVEQREVPEREPAGSP